MASTTMMEEEIMAIEGQEHYCPICGKEVTDPTWKRFGEWCCSEAHAEEYVREVRARRQAPATPREQPVATIPEGYESRRPAWGWRRRRRGC